MEPSRDTMASTTFESIQSEIATWPPESIRRLQGFLVALGHQRDGQQQRFADKLNDDTPSHWVTLEEAEEKLGLGEHDSGEE